MDDLYSDLLAEGIYNVKIIAIGKSQYDADNTDWTDGNSIPVLVDPTPYNTWSTWEAAQRDLFFLDSNGDYVTDFNISTWNYDNIYNTILELLTSEDIPGCTNSGACNYDPAATIEDGSCAENDCAGLCGGDALDDNCGICDTDSENDNSPSTGICDCAGMPNGTATVDCAGVCEGNSVLSGCDNTCNSTAVVDCAGICGGSSIEDCSGVCGGDDNTCNDCLGVQYGDNELDNCGTCDSDPTNDCNFYCTGDTISEEDQNQTFDVCYPCETCDGWSLSDYSGDIIFLDMSASWCAPCFSSIDFIDNLEEYWSEISPNVKFITALSDIDQPYSCGEWGLAGLPGSPTIVEDIGTLFNWFQDSNGQYPSYVIIDHEMKVRAKPSSVIENTNTAACDGSIDSMDSFDGGCINEMIDELLNEMHADNGTYCDDIWACNYNTSSHDGCRYPPEWEDLDGDGIFTSNYACCGDCISDIDCFGECGGDATWEDCQETDIDLSGITFVCDSTSVDYVGGYFHNTECDFTSIQEALDSENVMDGDTVIVEHGTYYENLILQKEITLASRALFDDMSTWVGYNGEYTLNNYNIKHTIINGVNDTKGEDYQSVILINSPSNECISPSVFGFTLQGGDGSNITVTDADGEEVVERRGGGFLGLNALPTLNYNYVFDCGVCDGRDDECPSAGGAGDISNGDQIRGGNRDYTFGTPECIGDIDLSYNFYRDNDALYGNTLATSGMGGTSLNMTYSIFDVYNCPGEEVTTAWVDVEEDVEVDFNNGVGDECTIAEDVWVSPNGDDDNLGTSEGEAFKTIGKALEMISPDANDPITINLINGTYSPSSGEMFPIVMLSNINIIGQSEEITIIDAESSEQNPSRVIEILGCSNNIISNLTITGGVHIRGGGIYLQNSNTTFNFVTITNNLAPDHGYDYDPSGRTGKGGGI